MTVETYAYLASSVISFAAGTWALLCVIGDARDPSNRGEPRHTVAASNLRRIAVLGVGVLASLVLAIWVVFFAPIPVPVARWLLVVVNASIALTLVFELVARHEYDRITRR